MLFSESLPIISPLNQDLCQDLSMQTMWRLFVGLSDKGFIIKAYIMTYIYIYFLAH